jgi:hypothetical protein
MRVKKTAQRLLEHMIAARKPALFNKGVDVAVQLLGYLCLNRFHRWTRLANRAGADVFVVTLNGRSYYSTMR